MVELIKVTTNEEGKQLVSARELHEFLEIGTDFRKWFPRMCEYGFIESIDYTPVKFVHPMNLQECIDYALCIDMAKELSMIQRTEKGKQARQYFIQCEKKLKEVQLNEKDMLMLNVIKADSELNRAVAMNEYERIIVKPLQDKAEYCDKVLQAEKLVTTTEIAKDLGMSAKKLHEILKEKKIIFKQGKSWIFYSRYQDKVPEYADYHVNEHGQTLKWTEKGRKWIIELIENI